MEQQDIISSNEQGELIVKSKLTFWMAAFRYSLFIIIPIVFYIFFILTAKVSELVFLPIIGIISIIWLILWILLTSMAYKINKNAEYHFFSDRIEYRNKFTTGSGRIINYNDIKYIRVEKGIFMKKYNLGSINIKLNKLMRTGQGKLNSLFIINTIENPDRLYNWLNSRIKYE